MGGLPWFVMVVFIRKGALIGLMGGLFRGGFGYCVLLAFPAREPLGYDRRWPAHRRRKGLTASPFF
jgi:hypothetical protein